MARERTRKVEFCYSRGGRREPLAKVIRETAAFLNHQVDPGWAFNYAVRREIGRTLEQTQREFNRWALDGMKKALRHIADNLEAVPRR